MKTGYKRIDAFIRHNQHRNLIVEVEDRSDGNLKSISVEVQQHVDPERTDLLACMQRAEWVRVHWCWISHNGATPRIASAVHRSSSLIGEPRDLIKDARKWRHLGVMDLAEIACRTMAENQDEVK